MNMEQSKAFDMAVSWHPQNVFHYDSVLILEQTELVTNTVEQLRESVREELIEEHSAELQKLRDERDVAVAKLQEAHDAEVNALRGERDELRK